jgi:plastocyanin
MLCSSRHRQQNLFSRHRLFVGRALLFIAAPATHAITYATDLTFTVIDEQGQPLKQAVVAITSPSIAAANTAPVVHVLDQVNKRFVPDIIAINKDDSIRFPNSDDIRHHVYSFSTTHTFELPLYSGEPENPVQFRNAGMVIVGCNIHDRMKGYIYILEDSRHAISTAGKATFTNLPTEALTVTVYHPQAVSEPALTITLQPNELATLQPLKITLNPIEPKSGPAGKTALEKKFQELRHAKH